MQPDEGTFPLIDDVISMIQECRAIPMAAWLDGTTSGEADIEALLDCQIAKGVKALNIIPDRNWNIADPETRNLKIDRLYECVAAAEARDLPVNVGTELNKFGQPWVDDFTAEPMRKIADSCIKGAEIMVGHSRLLRWADLSYIDARCAELFTDIKAQNDFFAAAGRVKIDNIAALDAGSAEANLAWFKKEAGL